MVFITHNDYKGAYQFFKGKGALSQSTAVSMNTDDWMTVGYKFKTGMELSKNTRNKGFIRVTEGKKIWFDLDGYVAFVEGQPREQKILYMILAVLTIVVVVGTGIFAYITSNI